MVRTGAVDHQHDQHHQGNAISVVITMAVKSVIMVITTTIPITPIKARRFVRARGRWSCGF